MEMRRLYRSRKNRWIAGVCGGIAEYFNIDPILIRILAVIIPGFGWIAYVLCIIFIPPEY